MSSVLKESGVAVRTFADAEEVLASALEGYEKREGQGRLAKAIEDAISNKTHLFGEGPVGVGKSLAYLIPAILSGKRAVVSTATKALQNQIWEKDIPFLQEHLMPFSAALLKGRGSYICVSALQDAGPEISKFSEIMALISPSSDSSWDVLINDSFSGERDDLPFEIENREWMKIAADSENCKAYGCKDTGTCYAELARRRAKQSNLVVVNHALYATDLMIYVKTEGKFSMIGDHSIFIADEVHEFAEYATNSLGVTFKEVGLRMLASEVKNFAQQYGLNVDNEVRAVNTAKDRLWSVLKPGRIRPANLFENQDEFIGLANALDDMTKAISGRILDHVKPTEIEMARKRRERVYAKAAGTAYKFASLVTDSFEDTVRWVEVDDRKMPVLHMAPIDIAPFFRENLFGGDTGRTAIMVSGTVSTNGNMKFMSETLGVDRYEEIIVESPFDFENQAMLYLPELPDPKEQRAAWSSMSINEMTRLINASEGRALLLFTSFSEMKSAYEMIAPMVPFKCIMQGQKPNKVLVEEFKEDIHSVLFGTRSFMTGIDLPGETLSLLVLNKLTFPVPTEPMFEAKSELVESRGGNSFFDLTLPVMSLTLHQAIGRLIHRVDDRGVAALLDPRVKTKGYGSGILKGLPPMRQTSTFTEVEDFFIESKSSNV